MQFLFSVIKSEQPSDSFFKKLRKAMTAFRMLFNCNSFCGRPTPEPFSYLLAVHCERLLLWTTGGLHQTVSFLIKF